MSATEGNPEGAADFGRLAAEMLHRRDAALCEAQRVLDVPGADVDASLFMAAHRARTCDEVLQMLARIDASVPA